MTSWERIPRWLKLRAPSRKGRLRLAVAGTATGAGSFIGAGTGLLPPDSTVGGIALILLTIIWVAVPELMDTFAVRKLVNIIFILSLSDRRDATKRMQIIKDLILGMKLVDKGYRPEDALGESTENEEGGR